MGQQILGVPYLTQPTGNTCQSTCLKMYGLYLSRRRAQSTAVDGKTVLEIWSEINTGNERPVKERNSYQNMVWWLNRHFPSYTFTVRDTRNTDDAMNYVVERIDAGFPVMVSTNHANTDGHIILVVGYLGAEKNACSLVKFVCHDPYGKFNPKSGSKLHGKRRFEGGASLADGGEVGPGKAVVYDHDGIRRIRSDKHSNGTYFLISGTGTVI